VFSIILFVPFVLFLLLLHFLSFYDIGLLITPLISLYILLRITASDYPSDIFIHPSTNYGFWLPIWYLYTSFYELRLLITPLISLFILLRFTASDYAFGISKHLLSIAKFCWTSAEMQRINMFKLLKMTLTKCWKYINSKSLHSLL
jgi:hypothetical protein